MVAEAQQRSTQSKVDIHLLGPRHLDSWLHCKGTIPGGLYILITSPVLAAQFPGCAASASSQVCHVSPQGADLIL